MVVELLSHLNQILLLDETGDALALAYVGDIAVRTLLFKRGGLAATTRSAADVVLSQ